MSAPSFSSFPPSFSSFPDTEAGPSRPHSKEKDKERKEKHGKKERKSKPKDGKRKHRDEPHASRAPSVDVMREERTRHAEADLEGNSTRYLFFTDTKGDPLNITYGTLHAGDVPKYHLVGRGRKILGLDNAWTVVNRVRGGVEVATGGKRKLPSISDSSARHILKAAPTRTLIASRQDRYQYREIDGFLRLTSHRIRTPAESYRAITAADAEHSEDDQSSSDDEKLDSSDEDSDTEAISSLQSTLESLEEQLAAEPSSILTWLNLLFHTLSTIPSDAKNASKMRSEITLSVLSRALDAHPSNKTSKTLRLRYLRAGEELWNASKLEEEWEDALKTDDVDLWIEWLDWRVRRVRGIEDIVGDAQRVLFAFGRTNDEIGSLRVLWRVAVAFRDAGFTERATAMFQAQAELTFNKPPSLSPGESQMQSLEAFWESEVLRAGEVNALGWAAWESSGRPEGDEILPGIPQTPPSGIHDPYSRWAYEESRADRVRNMPTRSSVDIETSDPYATILFSDIQPLLLDLKSSQAKQTFRLIWLSFVGLHIPGFASSLSQDPADNRDDRWSSTAFSSSHCISSLFPRDTGLKLLTSDAQAGVIVGRERDQSSPFGPIKQWGFHALNPLERIGSVPWGMWANGDVTDVDETLAREIFRQCRMPGPDTDWDTLNLAFEAAINLKNATKVSKLLLANAQNSCLHWAAHARLERLRGRTADARKVYQTVLASATAKVGASILWWDWAEMEWLARDNEAALQVVIRSAGSSGTSGVVLLRAKRRLEDASSEIPVARWKEREAWARLRALLELLTASPAAAQSVFDAQLDKLNAGTIPHESMMVASLCMLYVYGSVLRNPLPPALLRDRVEKALEIYPSNTILLALFLEAEKGQAVWGRLRSLLSDHSVDQMMRGKDVARRVAEVWATGWERGTWKAEEERIRTGLSSALQDERTRYSPVLWRVYLEFEIRANQLQKAKKLLFRAIGECPLVKDLYLLAFGPLRSVFSPRELNELAETMAERGIRMRQGLDEVLEGWSDPTANRHIAEVGENDAEDEIEYNARELRRLRPY